MSRWLFKAYTDKGESISRYGFRTVLNDEELKSLTGAAWWQYPYFEESSMMERAKRVAYNLQQKWSSEFGSYVIVKVWQDSKLVWVEE